MKTNIQKKQTIINSGTYTGANSDNRAIPHGLGQKPKVVLIHSATVNAYSYTIFGTHDTIINRSSGAVTAVTAMDTTNFYVGNVASYSNTANANGVEYDWIAFV